MTADDNTRTHAADDGGRGDCLLPGARVAHYEIVEVLGRGGMGIVYRARQDSPARDVALKLIGGRALSRNAIRRFEFEAEVLGRLKHVGVAQVYDAGVHDGDPYFAMELVEGAPLTEYARRADLDVPQRLALLMKICDAVQHAHAKGVVHRDLKPGNILVTHEGQPKILDFGVARATGSDIQAATIRTEIGQLVGTVPYMSPEQAAGDPNEIDTRSDVYALGVIAYELLAGRLPYDLHEKLIHEAVRVIREDDPAPLSSIDRTLRGDVEVIIGKALAKEKERRYQSAHDLGTDIGHYLNDEPIEARPPSASYQVQKFARRNRALVGGAVAVLVALVLGLVGTLWQATLAAERARIAIAAEAKAQREATTATSVSDFLAGMLGGVGPLVARGRDTALLREIADRTVERVDSELADQALVRSRLLRVVGMVYHDLADYDRAEALVRRSIEAAELATGEDPVAVARAKYDLARIYDTRAQFDEAQAAYRETYDAYVTAGLGETHNALSALTGLGVVQYRRGQIDEAVATFREALARRRELEAGKDTVSVAGAMDKLASALLRADPTSDEPMELTREALAMQRRLFDDPHPDIAVSLTNLASQLAQRGRFDEALALAQEGLEQHRTLYGDRHPYTASSLASMATVLQKAGRMQEAIAAANEALEINREVFGPEHRNTLDAYYKLGTLMSQAGDHAGAEAQFRVMLDWARAHYPPGDKRLSSMLKLVAAELSEQGRQDQAEALLRETQQAASPQ